MVPANQNRKPNAFAGIAILTLISLVFAFGSAQARLIDWTSAELIYSPLERDEYSSDCLVADGQRIVLSDLLPDESERIVSISVKRPEPLPEPTDPPEETEPEDETQDPTDATTEETEPAPSEETEPIPEEETETPSQEITWSQAEVTVTMDAAARLHLNCDALVEEDSIQIHLSRKADAPGLEQTQPVSIDVEWFGLKGTICLNILPYGLTVPEEPVVPDPEDPAEQEEPRHEIVTDLTHVIVSDTMNPDNPVACVKLNLDTGSDYTLTFISGDNRMNMVRWSMDRGESYSLLYDSSTLTIPYPYPDGWDGTLLLDFGLSLDKAVRPTISVMATGYQLIEFKPVLQAPPAAAKLILKTADLPQTIEIAPKWGAAVMQIQKIEILTKDEEDNLSYQDDMLWIAEVTDDGIQLNSADSDILPPSGSYRVTIHWVWDEAIIETQTIYFFVNTH